MYTSETGPTLEMMQRFVDVAGQLYDQKTQDRLRELRADNLRCVDDRYDGPADIIATPGAGLGVLVDIFGGFKLLGAEVDFQCVVDVYVSKFGMPSYHTDIAELGAPLCCAGCGHCSNVLANPQQYLLSEGAVAFLNDYVPRLAEQVEPTVYVGTRNALATIIVQGTGVGLTARYIGESVFVYQSDWHQLYLRKAADALSEALGIDANELADAFIKAAADNLAVTLEKLAKNLPVYTLRAVDGELVLSEY